MSAREWKPGDVAEVGVGRAMRHESGHWVFPDGSYNTDDQRIPTRPLVVIDPEDREQVDRLVEIMVGLSEGTFPVRLQEALRDFANPKPPKPDEPTGVASLVEDADGAIWARQCSGAREIDMSHPWIRVSNGRSAGSEDRERSWRDVAAVRVLSEGVSTDA